MSLFFYREGRDGWVRDTFEVTPPMSTFTLGWVIGDLDKVVEPIPTGKNHPKTP